MSSIDKVVLSLDKHFAISWHIICSFWAATALTSALGIATEGFPPIVAAGFCLITLALVLSDKYAERAIGRKAEKIRLEGEK